MATSVDVFTIQSDHLPAGTRVLAFTGMEGLSRPYLFDIHVLVPAHDAETLDPFTVLGQPGSLHILAEDGTPKRTFHGIISQMELVHELGGDALYRIELSPRFFRLALSHHSRVYANEDFNKVFEKVARNGELTKDRDFAIRFPPPPPYAHLCQYRESDLDFLSRLMEREGFYYYFEHGDSQEILVVVNSLSLHADSSPANVAFFPTAEGDTSTVEALHTFVARHTAVPREVRVKDYDYLNPPLDVAGDSAIPHGTHGIQRFHGDNFLTPTDGRRIAGRRKEEHQSYQLVFHASGRVFNIAPGFYFTLEHHARHALNARYLAVEVRHTGSNASASPTARERLGLSENTVYKVDVAAIPAAQQFRPLRVTPTPRIHGVEMAVVDGPVTSPYAQLDSNGRYKVKVFFDEGTERDGKASMLVRMLQPHGGNPEGFHFPLRKGTEVMLVFLGGDPDRPMIAGAAPNAERPSVVTESNHTQNVIHTGSDNRIEIEDLQGSQYIDIMSPPQTSQLHLGAHDQRHHHNWVITTDGNGLLHTGGEHNVTVGADMTEDVRGNLTETYHGTQTTTVTKAVSEEYKATFATHTIGAVSQTFDSTLEVHVKGDVDIKYDSTLVRNIGTGEQHTVKAGGQTVKITGATDVTNTGTYQQTITAGGTIISPAGYTIIAPAGHKVIASGGVTIIAIAGIIEVAPGGKKEQHSDWFKVTSVSVELVLGSKISVGLSKVDIFATGLSMLGLKGDIYGVKKETLGAYIREIGAQISTAATAIKNGAVNMKNYVVFLVT